MTTRFEIKTDTGISGTFVWNSVPQSQDEMRRALARYGEWIYEAGGAPVQYEYRNHWLPKLAAAKTFELTELAIIESA